LLIRKQLKKQGRDKKWLTYFMLGKNQTTMKKEVFTFFLITNSVPGYCSAIAKIDFIVEQITQVSANEA